MLTGTPPGPPPNAVELSPMFGTAKRRASKTSTGNWSVNFLLEEVEDCWHFHQLLHQLRLATRKSRRDLLEDDLEHVDSLVGNRRKRVDEVEDSRSCSTNKNIEHRQTKRGVDDLLHSVPLYPFLRADTNEAFRPSPFGVLKSSGTLSSWSRSQYHVPGGGFFRNSAV